MASTKVLPRVYSMGTLPLTGLVSHCIAALPNQPEIPQVVSLLPSEQKLRLFLNNNSTLKLRQYASNRLYNLSEVQLMSACRPPIYGDGSYAPIGDLILGMNHHEDIKQIMEYKKCLNPDSNVVLLNTNRAAIMRLVDKVWGDPADRPNIYQCLSDFRVWKDDEFEFNVLGDGSLKIAKFPRFTKDLDAYSYDLSSNLHREGDILKLIKDTRILNPSFISYQDFALQQAEYMIVKTCIGSLSSLFDCTNGELLKMNNLTHLLSKHIDECATIILKSDPLLNRVPYSRVFLNRDRLLDVSISLLKRTERESSLLRRTVNLYSRKELASTTGFFAQMAIRHETPGSYNVLMNQLLNAKHSLRQQREFDEDYTKDRIELEL